MEFAEIDNFLAEVVMITDTLILVVVCFFYGFAHRVFPQNIADSPEEARATLSTGISVNHFITIFIALFGGWIWKALGMETLFILSAILGLCNSAYAATIQSSEKRCGKGVVSA